MAYTDWKFFDPPADKTDAEKVEDQKNLIANMEEFYWEMKQKTDFPEEELTEIENRLAEAKTTYEDMGGTYD